MNGVPKRGGSAGLSGVTWSSESSLSLNSAAVFNVGSVFRLYSVIKYRVTE